MHRSATSLLSGCLEAAGLFLGTVNNAAPFNKNGNKENESIRDLHDSILARHGFDWKAPPDTPLTWTAVERRLMLDVLEPYRSLAIPWGFKDPRVVWLIDEWLEIFPDATLISVFRHPLLVAQSLAERPGDLHMSIEQGLHLWFVTNRRILNLHRDRAFPILHFTDGEALQAQFFQPLSTFTRQHDLKGDPRVFFDQTLVNQTKPAGEIPRDVRSLYDELIVTCKAVAKT
jgi:hypothetical protein